MAKSKRKRELAARDKREGRQLLRIVLIGGAVLILLLYLMYRGISS